MFICWLDPTQTTLANVSDSGESEVPLSAVSENLPPVLQLRRAPPSRRRVVPDGHRRVIQYKWGVVHEVTVNKKAYRDAVPPPANYELVRLFPPCSCY